MNNTFTKLTLGALMVAAMSSGFCQAVKEPQKGLNTTEGVASALGVKIEAPAVKNLKGLVEFSFENGRATCFVNKSTESNIENDYQNGIDIGKCFVGISNESQLNKESRNLQKKHNLNKEQAEHLLSDHINSSINSNNKSAELFSKTMGIYIAAIAHQSNPDILEWMEKKIDNEKDPIVKVGMTQALTVATTNLSLGKELSGIDLSKVFSNVDKHIGGIKAYSEIQISPI